MRLEQVPRAEAADVAVRHVRAVVQLDNSAPIRVVTELPGRPVTQAPRHSEVDQEHAAGFESDDQVLAAALERGDALALELRRDRERLEGADEPPVVDLDSLERATDDVRFERETDRLDLG